MIYDILETPSDMLPVKCCSDSAFCRSRGETTVGLETACIGEQVSRASPPPLPPPRLCGFPLLTVQRGKRHVYRRDPEPEGSEASEKTNEREQE